jgi:hypothetical protein
MKIIEVTRKGTPESGAYEDLVIVHEDGKLLYTGDISTEPNPYQPATAKVWTEVYARIAEGSYRWKLMTRHHTYGRCLLLNGGGATPTLNPNINHSMGYIATEIFIHRGDNDTWRGSRGCLTIPPSKADIFFNLFADNETGKLILRKATT